MTTSQADTPPPGPGPVTLDRALALVEFLRANCPWDAAQTPLSLRRYLLEEAHEVVDAIEADDAEALRDELGDLLLNLAFQIVIAEERGAFGREEVVTGLERKMERRHPHLYGGEHESWDRIKARERGDAIDAAPNSIIDPGLATADSLRHAYRIQARVAEVGFDWPDTTGALEKVREEVDEVAAELELGNAREIEEEMGDLLFAVVNLARLAGVDPGAALTRANRKFTNRFHAVEARARAAGVPLQDAGLEQLDRFWTDAKREGK